MALKLLGYEVELRVDRYRSLKACFFHRDAAVEDEEACGEMTRLTRHELV